MKMHRLFAVALALVVLLGSGLTFAENNVKSGPQVGEDLAGPFHPLNVTGKAAGKKFCLYCSNGSNPVAMVFAREVTPELSKLLKKIDTVADKNSDCKMGSFVVFCSSDESLEAKAKKLASDSKLKHVVLSIDNPAGPEGYKVAKEADVTVVLYVDRVVKANFAFKKGELKEKHIEEIASAAKKILPSK